MKRTLKKKLPDLIKPIPKKFRWKKVTGGLSVLANGIKVRKDEIFYAFADEIPSTFKRKFVCLDEQEPAPEPGIKITLVPLAKNKWNLVNEYTGDIVNETPLSAEAAKAFLEEGQNLPEGPKEEKETKKVTPSKKEKILKEKAKARKRKVPKDLPVETDDEEEYDD